MEHHFVIRDSTEMETDTDLDTELWFNVTAGRDGTLAVCVEGWHTPTNEVVLSRQGRNQLHAFLDTLVRQEGSSCS